MAKSYEEFRTHGKQMVEYICDYIKNLDKVTACPVDIEPGFLAPLLPKTVPEFPESYKEVMNDFEKKILPGTVHWNSPDFFGYFGSGNGYPSILGDMLSTSLAGVGFSWSSCPAINELESIVCDWYAKALGLPEFFLSKASNPRSIGGGTLQGSASDAIFTCMNSARSHAIKVLKAGNEDIHDSVFLPRLVCYASTEAHSSVEKAAKMNLVKIRTVEPDSKDSMRGDALERAVAQDVALGLTPFLVVATLGTTSQTAFDNLVEISAVVKKYPSLWFHVDGAFGVNSFVLPEMRALGEGIENADSLDVNPNKLMMTGFDCTCMYVKDTKKFIDAFTIDPLYLQHQFNDDVVDLRHFGIPLSRRFRSLKLYFTFRMYGLKGMQDYMRRIISCGKHFENLVRSDDRFEVRNEVRCGLVCFRLLQDENINQELVARLNGSGKIHLTPAKCRGKYIIRLMACQDTVNEEQMNKAWKTITQCADELLREVEQAGGKKLTRRMTAAQFQRFSFTRIIKKDQVANTQQLYDGATPIVVVDTGNF